VTTVLLADDQDLVRSGLRLMLELADIEVVGEAPDGATAVELAAGLADRHAWTAVPGADPDNI
jgi:DNA-binding NarL/FixJ family response regulator